MPALGITHSAHSAVIKTPDFPQDSSPCFLRWKGNTHVENSPPFTSREEDYIFRQAKWDNDSGKQLKEGGKKDKQKESKG